MKRTAIALALGCLAFLPHATHAQDAGGDGTKTIVLPDPDHPINGTWQVVHGAGTVVCPQMAMPIPAGNPDTVHISVHDGGARLEMAAPDGRMTLRRVGGQGRWESESQGDALVLRRKMRSDNAALVARALEGDATIYEGTQTPTAGMTIHYILGWTHGERGVMRGHLASAHQGCKILRSFSFQRGS